MIKYNDYRHSSSEKGESVGCNDLKRSTEANGNYTIQQKS